MTFLLVCLLIGLLVAYRHHQINLRKVKAGLDPSYPGVVVFMSLLAWPIFICLDLLEMLSHLVDDYDERMQRELRGARRKEED